MIGLHAIGRFACRDLTANLINLTFGPDVCSVFSERCDVVIWVWYKCLLGVSLAARHEVLTSGFRARLKFLMTQENSHRS